MNYILVFLAGMCLACMQSFNGQLGQFIGLLATSLMTHVIGGLCLGFYILGIKKEKLKFTGMPLPLYSAGCLGLILVFCTSFCVARIGAVATTGLSIVGQVMGSILIDHFGLFGVRRVPFKMKRIPALCVIAAGLILIVLA